MTEQRRYGYLDMPADYSDVAAYPIRAICPHCQRRHYVLAEDAGGCRQGIPLVDDLCSEYDGVEHIDNRQHEW